MNVKLFKVLAFVLGLLPLNNGMAQKPAIVLPSETITITGGDIHDAMIHSNLRPGFESSANTNYKNHPRIAAVAWTNSGYSSRFRSLLYFNLSGIPGGSTIQSATLYLYSDPAVTGASDANGNSQHSGSNAFYLEKITTEWSQSTVTWNNQPSTTTSGRISVGASTSTTENRQVDLKTVVQEWINNPVTNNGLKMILQNEAHFRSRNYASTNHSNSTLHPKLVVTFTPPATSVRCGTPDLTESEVMALPWYGSDTFLSDYNDSLEAAFNAPSMARVAGDIEIPFLRIPIHFWGYQIAPGNPGGNDTDRILRIEETMQVFMDELNNAARNNGIKFRFYVGGYTPVNRADALFINGFTEEVEISTLYRNLTAVNVHIVDGINGARGRYNPLYNAIFIDRNTATFAVGATTFTHEIAHFFGVLHTDMFSGIICLREPVTRDRSLTNCPNGPGFTKRCRFTGDLLCDTDADPNMAQNGNYNEATCTWDAQGTRDFNGHIYHPDPRNYMSAGNEVGNPPCNNHFSNDQKNIIHFWAFSRQLRPNWVIHTNNQFDKHEPDDADVAARNIALGETQTHTFHVSGRTDNQDWLRFNHPATGSLYNYQLLITQTVSSSVNSIQVFASDDDFAGTPVTGITSSTAGNVTTYTIPCTSLIAGTTYLIRVNRGGSGYREYDVHLKTSESTPITVTGPSNICNSNATYVVQGVPAGNTIIWTRSTNLTYISGQGTTSYVVKSNGGGAAWVEATISNACGARTIRKNIQIGTSISGHTVSGTQSVCIGNEYTYTAVIPGGHKPGYVYTWTVPSGWTKVIQLNNTLIARPFTSFGGGILGYTVNAGCGNSSFVSMTVSEQPCFTSFMTTHPNPAQDDVTIESRLATDEIAMEESPDKEIYSISILDKTGQLLKELKFDKPVKSIKVSLNDLKSDYYFLKVFDGTQWETFKIIKE